jgi:hypothetical protein
VTTALLATSFVCLAARAVRICVHHVCNALVRSDASRLSAAGTPDLLVAQMVGHSGTSILHVYAKAIDESRREAMTNSRHIPNLT